MIYALVAYPLSRAYRDDIERLYGSKPEYLTIADLRRESVPRLLKRLRRLAPEQLLLPFEDAHSESLLPILSAVASVTRARRIEVVRPDLSRKVLSRIGATWKLAETARASVSGRFAARACMKELGALNAQPRIPAKDDAAGRIAYLKTNLWFGVKAGGSVGHVAGVANALMRTGRPLTFIASEKPILVDDSADFQFVPPLETYGIPTELNLYRYHLRYTEQAMRLLADKPVSMIYQRLSLANYSGVVLSRRLGVPLIIEYNGSEAWVQKNWGQALRFHDLAVAAEDACLRHAHVVVTISDVLRDELIARGVDAGRIVTYPNCIDPEVFDPARFDTAARNALRARYGLTPDDRVATFIGTFGMWHGVDVLAQSIRILVDRHRDVLNAMRLRFLLVGDGAKWREVSDLLSGESYSDYVTLTGLVPQSDAPLHLAASDLLLSPHVRNTDGTRFFGSPTKLFEYMAMGKPIIASDLDQIGDIFAGSPRVDAFQHSSLPSGAMALLTEPGDPEDLARAILTLTSASEDTQTTLGERARQAALSKYTWDEHVARILSAVARVT